MKVVPMIFNTDMVKALLDGRKTLTRRPAKNLSFSERVGFIVGEWAYGLGWNLRETMNNCIRSKSAKCPAQIGDLIYVRETYQGPLFDAEQESDYLSDRDKYKNHKNCVYAATDPKPCFFDVDSDSTVSRWKPSIHMPRWASRLTLKVTDVRIEKLNELRKCEEQIKKEGFESWPRFKHVWEGIYGQSNPNDYVWVIEFEVIHQNVDEYLESIKDAA